MFKLLRHFSLCSAAITAMVTAMLVYGYYSAEMAELVEATERENISISRALANALVGDIQAYTEQFQSMDPDVLRKRPETAEWHERFRRAVSGLPVLKVKIYTVGGKTIFSSEPAQIGNGPSSGVQFDAVINSNKSHSKLEFRPRFVSFDGVIENRHVVGTYVAVLDKARRPRAVLELYTDVTAQVTAVTTNIWRAGAGISGAFALLYLALLLIVRRADIILHRQYDAVAKFNSTLEGRVAERTRQAEQAVTAASAANLQLRSEIDERRRAEHAMLTKGQRLTVLLDALSGLMRGNSLRQDDISKVYAALTESAAISTGTSRVSIWMASEDRLAMHCTDLFDSMADQHTSGQRIEAAAYPRYFQSLRLGREIVADDVRTHLSTKEFLEPYLKPRNICSMLDVPILRDGVVEGIVCFEQVGEQVSWAAEQRLFALTIASIVVMVQEHHERARAEEDLRRANASLAAATQAKSRFLANMSHEIRTPMSGILGMTELLSRTSLSDQQHRLVTTIRGSTNSLLTIINDILDLSRIEAGKLVLEPMQFDLRECVEEAVDLFVESADRKGLALSAYIAPEVAVSVIGDAGRLRQICLNLIGNAVKFTHAGEIAVRVLPGRAGSLAGSVPLLFEVRDSGIGIDPSVQDKLAQPFVQADSSITRQFGGTGLGLSISRHLIELMGGTMAIASTLGQGTKISFELELRRATETMTPPGEALPTLLGRHVLLVDDRETDREIMRSYLCAQGARVSVADRLAVAVGSEANQQRHPFTTVILDATQFPGCGEALTAVAAAPALTGVGVALTFPVGWTGASGKEIANRCGVLTKPVRARALINAVAALGSVPKGAGGLDHDAPDSIAGDDTALSSLGLPHLTHESRLALSALCAKPTVESPSVGRIPDCGAGPSSSDAPNVMPLPSCRVLLVEDNPVNIEVARAYLDELGCSTTLARNGREAVAAFEHGPYDVVLMDCQMPEMDGLAATLHIRAWEVERKASPVPIIAVTASAFDEDRQSCLAAGMNDYLVKPFSQQSLTTILARWRRLRPVSDAAITERRADGRNRAAARAPTPTMALVDAPAPTPRTALEPHSHVPTAVPQPAADVPKDTVPKARRKAAKATNRQGKARHR